MATFIYQPGIRVYIKTDRFGTLDVSDDVTDFEMVRRSDGVSTFNFSLQNTRRKYDGVLTPNDRIVVLMKRLTWMREFTGYLNSVPLVTAWPREVPLSASCSLKRLQYWFWDSYVSYTQNLIRSALGGSNLAGQDGDGGIINVVLKILREVVGWPESKVHIAKIPDDWMKIAYKIAQQVDELATEADKIAAEFYATIGGGGMIGGEAPGLGAGGSLPAGKYGDTSLTAEQTGNAVSIYSAGVREQMSVRDIQIAVMTAMTESSLRILNHGDRVGPDSRGLFQQRDSWGELSVRMDAQGSAGLFFRALKRHVPNRNEISPWLAAQRVQISAFSDGSNYRPNWDMAQAVVNAIVGGRSTVNNDPARQAASSGGVLKPGQATNRDLLAVSLKLVRDHPNIRYEQENSNRGAWTNPNPTVLDCSRFTMWVYGNTTGSLNGMPRRATLQARWCKDNGKVLTVAQGMRTPGAFMFTGNLNYSPHVEVSLGDGERTVGAHSYGQPASVARSGASYWSHAYLPPGLVGTDIGTGGGASDFEGVDSGGTSTGTSQVPVPYSQAEGYNDKDPWDRMFGDNPWMAPGAEQNDPNYMLAQSLGGVRALLNDQPLLPYLKNLFNSTMRSFCSAPNGDLIAWFPDYYGLWGTAAKMVIEPIELQDFTVQWSDDFFVTHQFSVAGQVNSLDVSTGIGSNTPRPAQYTLGIATVEIPALLYAVLGIEATEGEAKKFSEWILKRFGARPDFQQMEGLVGPKAEFFSAIFLFMRQWAYQYNADVPLTFMPEIWPGMLIQIPFIDFQAYVTTVTHSGRLGEGGGFQTTVNIAAPARMPKGKNSKDHVLIGLPVAGGFAPGRKIGDYAPSADFLDKEGFANRALQLGTTPGSGRRP